MRPRSYEQFVAALHILGCEAVTDLGFYLVMVRGGMILQTVPKTLLTVEVQTRILRAFSIAEESFLDALSRIH